VFVPGGQKSSDALAADGAAVLFVREAYMHCKAVGGGGTGVAMLKASGITDAITTVPAFLKATAQHRDWSREERAQRIPV
jgi:catalase